MPQNIGLYGYLWELLVINFTYKSFCCRYGFNVYHDAAYLDFPGRLFLSHFY